MREGECTEVDYVNPCGEVLELNEDHERTIWYLNIAPRYGNLLDVGRPHRKPHHGERLVYETVACGSTRIS